MALSETAQAFRFPPPSQVRSFLNLPGSFEYLLTGGSSRRRLPDDLLGGAGAKAKNVILLLIDGWGWKKAFDVGLPLVARISREGSTLIRQIDSGFPTTTAAMLPSLYTGQPPAAHGYVEWRHYEDSLGAMINILPWRLESDHGQRESLVRRGVDPTTILREGTFFRELKDEGVTGGIGISTYVTDDPAALAQRFRPDAVQVPFSLLDQRLLRDGSLARLKDLGVEIHTRSIFLQGLLLMERPPERLAQAGPMLARVRRRIAQAGATPLSAALAFVLSRPEVDVAVLGVAALAQLEEILAVLTRPLPEMDWAACALDDTRVLTPSLW